ncbi:SDR family oxidoreductase [Thiohalophilus sp.]|uniref:SDR family oxidoreductase n=1 Tax=Thiohalophilus sp. TaxID=3028392 RepID=UPI002ACE6952|nr:SDR family oxidoreductase [Thiohalophilus sp.]MDZ7803507.1 SDR family oxidoreductase [Thiohalophilus sp.]
MNPAVKPPEQVFIVGCGDIGRRVARLWQAEGIPVTGLVRNGGRLTATGIPAYLADLDDPASLSDLPVNQALVYYFAPPPQHGQDDPRMAHFLQALDQQGSRPQRIVYISTSGVYGDRQGEIVSEDTAPNPQVDRARRRYAAEQALREWGRQHAVPVIVLRVGGIYGPDRLPIKRLREQVPMVHEALAPQTNRIHAADLAAICVAAARRGTADAIYNVSDGNDSNMTQYFNTVADFLGLPRPPLIDRDEAQQTLSEGMLSYLGESRRMDTSRLREELGIQLQYPTLQEGLEATCQRDRDELRGTRDEGR